MTDFKCGIDDLAGVAFACLAERGREEVKFLPFRTLEEFGKQAGEALREKGHSLFMRLSRDDVAAALEESGTCFKESERDGVLGVEMHDWITHGVLVQRFLGPMPLDMMLGFMEKYDWLVKEVGGGIMGDDITWLKNMGFKDKTDKAGRLRIFGRKIAGLNVTLHYSNSLDKSGPMKWLCWSKPGFSKYGDTVQEAFKNEMLELHAALKRELNMLEERVNQIDDLLMPVV